MIILHEGDISALPVKILKKHGFRKWPKNRDNFLYGLKINASHALLDNRSGFLHWKRKHTPKGRFFGVIMIPEPIRTEADLKRIIERISTKYAHISSK